MRLSTVDAIVKGIARSTNTVLAAEVSVKSTDASSGASGGSASLSSIHLNHKELSPRTLFQTIHSIHWPTVVKRHLFVK